ncbi:hypothetical protein GDO78_013238 [Eleutherodactylus coqui]|uniref:Uncharacterized protein n=1 Tax=Eleutherodactylus coqui TaxID=57060 RepID=A0A8J6EYI1_ELECQ|nr:hypothetical protein GDO78_013238 [Eleutherodactylus coqui]
MRHQRQQKTLQQSQTLLKKSQRKAHQSWKCWTELQNLCTLLTLKRKVWKFHHHPDQTPCQDLLWTFLRHLSFQDMLGLLHSPTASFFLVDKDTYVPVHYSIYCFRVCLMSIWLVVMLA